ncbi:hypothetical protein QTG54_014354 [Skeletonema marinoi]|uniref:Uncharacterized protein n=1 Tax=Skeletonema marinoi TaxID=267567 RepID=A0AAD9D6P5_9STRA|nr:hypothetical protein QTG54_014354 [Skeletonema marinoi]
MTTNNIIYVCQSGTCRSKGSSATLVEIEELAKHVDTDCQVQRSGCLGYCRQGPAVEVIQAKSKRIVKRRYHFKINTLQKSASVIEDATGETLPMEHNLPEETKARLANVRATKQREYFMLTYQWNKALAGFTTNSESSIAKNHQTIRDVLGRAGYPDLNPCDIIKKDDPPLQLTTMPSCIDSYVLWNLTSVDVVTHHTAIFHFETNDPKRGTPHPRGRARLAEPITWHVTMLAEIYDGGVLSTWLNDKTSPASFVGSGSNTDMKSISIWLSKPIKTLTVPSLIADDDDGFRPNSVLLLLAGTGIVALPQILAHKEPHRLLGISVPKYKQMNCPIDLIHSCHEDDVLLLQEIKQYCLDGVSPRPNRKFRGLRNYTLLITRSASHNDGVQPPFQQAFNDDKEAINYRAILKGVPNASIRSSRLNKNVIADAVERLEGSYRIVVSGPDSYNNAARGFLEECGVDSKSVTILSA